MAEKYSLPGIEERIVPVGDSERLGYFVTGTDVELEPQNVERFRNESESDVVRTGYTIYDPEQKGVHQFTPSGEYVGFAYAPRREGVGGFFGDVAEELGPILSMIPATAPYMAAINAARAAKTGDWEKAALSALGAAAPIAGQFGASADTVAKLAEANKYARLASAVGSGRPEALITAGAGFLPKDIYGHDPSLFKEGTFKYNQAFDPETAGLVDLSEPSIEGYEFTKDFTPGANLTIGPTESGLGLKTIGSEGFKMPEVPNLESMGGGQGIFFPVEGGFITERGFIPSDYAFDLGDPESFINKPATGADVSESVQKALDASAKATFKDLTKNGTQKTTKEQPNLLAVLGGRQGPIPLVVPENAADIKLMQDIFGTSLSAPSTGNETDRDEALARLLRS